MKRVDFRFAWAHPVEDLVDIHGHATYHCADCGEPIVFDVMTLAESLARTTG